MIEFHFFGMPIKTLGSLGKVRVGKPETHFFGLSLRLHLFLRKNCNSRPRFYCLCIFELIFCIYVLYKCVKILSKKSYRTPKTLR